MVRKAARITIWAIAALLGLIVLLWLVLLVYVNANEKRLIGRLTTVVEKRTKGPAEIGGLSVSFIRTFPMLSLQLSDVLIRDSLYPVHQKNLLKASAVYLRVSIPGLITGNLPVGRVIIDRGEINIISDTAGNSNEYVLKSGSRSENETFGMPDLLMRHMTINYEAPERNKHYHALVRSLRCNNKEKKDRLEFDIKMSLLVKNLSFNTVKGAYLKEKLVDGNFELVYLPSSKEIVLDNIRLDLDDHPFYFTGKFSTDKTAADFDLTIRSNNILYRTATSFLTEKLQKKLNQYSLTKPIAFTVKLSGKTARQSVPAINVEMEVKNNEVITPRGAFDNCSFTGVYSNEKFKGKPRTDENSILQFSDFRGRWENIVISSKKILISDLIHPFLECDIASDVDMKSLNSLTGSSTIQFERGKTNINVVFKGPVAGNDSIASNINGTVDIFDASVRYLPRNFLLSSFNGSLRFNDNDLVVKKITATTGKTKLDMNGSARNFLSLLNVSPEKLLLTWNISSPALHLEDFKSFLSKAPSKKSERKEAKFQAAASKIDKMFSDGDMIIRLESPVMDYKTFRATDVTASVLMKPLEITFEKVQLKHANGSMEVSGSLKNGEQYNPVTLKTVMRDIDVPLLFTAFDNFGQDAVTYKNLKGRLSANINFNTAVNNNAKLISDASEGSIHFLLENGELNNFEPLLEISRKAFKKQDFSQIRFADVKNRLEVKGTTFIVNTMDIRSTALNFVVEGIYDVKKGTDMSIRFPLNNLTRSQANTDISDGGRSRKGVTLRLRVKTGDDGKLKVSWDPFRRSIKKKEEIQDSAEAKQEDR